MSLVDDAPLSKFHLKLAAYSAGGPFLDGYALTVVGVALITMKPGLSLDSLETGMIGAAALVGILFGGALFGYVTDRIGRRLMYIADLLALTLLSLASAFVDEAWQLIALRLLLGIAIGADYPIASSLLAEFAPRRYRGRLLGLLLVVWAAGAAAAAGCGWALSYLGPESWRYMLASPAVFGAATLLLRLGTPESARWLRSQGRLTEAQAVCRKVWGPGADVNDIPDEPAPCSYTAVFRGVYLKRFVFVAIFYSAHVIPLFAIYTFGPDILLEMGLDEGGSTYVAELIISGFFLVGGIPGLLLVDRVGRKPLLTVTFVIMGATLAFMAMFPTAPAVVLFTALAVYAITSGACNFLELVVPAELFPTNIRATATGAVVAASRVGSATSTFLLPLLLSHHGLAAVMWLLAAVNILGLAATVILGEETKGKALAAAAGTTADAPVQKPHTEPAYPKKKTVEGI